MMGERDLEVELKEKDEIIMSLRLNEHLLKDKLEIFRRNMGKQLERIKELEKENEQLRQFINKGRRLSVKELMNNMNENELLKTIIRKDEISINTMMFNMEKLEKENEKLRKRLRECRIKMDKFNCM